MNSPLDIVILGLSITSSWGNGHATTFRSLVKGLARRGHRVLFLERDVKWYADNRDLEHAPYCRVELYRSLEELRSLYDQHVREADLVMLGSYVAEGVPIADWIANTATGALAFYDIDTPVTLAKLRNSDREYLAPESIPKFDMYLTFTGGPVLNVLERDYGARMARPLYCSVDPDLYFAEETIAQYNLGYMGTYSADRQPPLEELLIEPARAWNEGTFVVAGPLYPDTIRWPSNVERIAHIAPEFHRSFYNSQRFTLNVTRAEMVRAGYSPSVRLFEAAACATAVISDTWAGLETFFVPGEEILISRSAEQTLDFIRDMPDEERARIGRLAMRRCMAEHTSDRRAEQLESYARTALNARSRGPLIQKAAR